MKKGDLPPSRAVREIGHGRKLAEGDTETIWGWGTPAGRCRAARRGRRIAEAAQLKPGMRVLEIGCGTNLFTDMFAQSGARLVAVDISSDLLEKAHLQDLPRHQVIFLQKRFEDCDVDGPFDAVIGSSILHHLEIEVALKKIYELLKPGGVMSFAEPNMLNPQAFLLFKLRFLFPYVSPDETAFTRGQMKKLLAGSGFERTEITPCDWLHPAVPASWIRAVQRIGAFLEKTPVVREFSGSLYIRARRPLSNTNSESPAGKQPTLHGPGTAVAREGGRTKNVLRNGLIHASHRGREDRGA